MSYTRARTHTPPTFPIHCSARVCALTRWRSPVAVLAKDKRDRYLSLQGGSGFTGPLSTLRDDIPLPLSLQGATTGIEHTQRDLGQNYPPALLCSM